MATSSEIYDAEVADLLARLKAKGINVGETPSEKMKSPTASSQTVRLISEDEPDVATEMTSLRKRKASVAEGSGIKQKKPATSQAPVRRSGRTKKGQVPVEKKEQTIPEEKVVKKSVAGGVEELRAKLDALESLPALLKEMEESAKINMIHGTQIKEEITELNRQLRFVGTELLDQLKLLVKD